MLEVFKICKKHGSLTLDKLIKSGKDRKGLQAYKCKQCMQDFHKKNYIKNKKIIRKKQDEYRQKDYKSYLNLKNKSAAKMRKLFPERERLRKKIQESKNPEQVRLRHLRHSRKKVKELTDNYVKHIIVSKSKILKRIDIPPKLIEMVREILRLKRIIKQQKKN